MTTADPEAAPATAVALATGLRAAGVAVGTGQVVTCQRALSTLSPTDAADRYWAGRLTLLSDPRDVPTYDAVFAAVTAGAPPAEAAAPAVPTADQAPAPRGVDGDTARAGVEDGEPLVVGQVAADRERLRHRRFDEVTEEELVAITTALHHLEVAVPRRWSRRTRTGGRGVELDLPRSLERALATDGELVDLAHRRRRTRPRRLVVLLDVSGSMAGHARALLRFALVARRSADREASRHVEVFAFGTRLTRLTPALSARDPDAALRAAAAEVLDWDGGTRIGASLEELVGTWGRRGVLRGAVVLVCSDGLERGDPVVLEAAMARLRRHVHRIVWVSPLAGAPSYRPEQRGVVAALPHVDRFLPGHDLASLEALSTVLADLR